MKLRFLLAGLLAAGLVGPAVAPAAAMDAMLEEKGWALITVPGQAETDFRLAPDGAVEIISDHSVAFLFMPVEDAEKRLEWRWQVEEMGVASNLATVGKDDRPMAIHLWFPGEEEQASLFGGMAELFGFPRVGNALTYVWGGVHDAPRISPNPYMPDGQGAIVALRSQADGEGEWRMENVEYGADFAAAFGKPAPSPTFIAISGDSDDLGGLRRGRISGLRFAP